MASLMNELLEVLENEEAGYRELVEASTRKKEVIIKADIRALEEITAEEQEIAGKIKNIENKRISIMEDIANVLNRKPEDLTVDALLEILANQPKEQEQLAKIRLQLKDTLTEMKNINEQNQTLVNQAMELVDDNTVVVVVDTNKPSYTECEELLYMTKTIVVLDHHRRGNEVIQNAVLSYVEPYASSTCEMVAEILQYFSDDLRLRNIEADCIYAGIMIDTNNFITRAGVRTFEAAAFLRRVVYGLRNIALCRADDGFDMRLFNTVDNILFHQLVGRGHTDCSEPVQRQNYIPELVVPLQDQQYGVALSYTKRSEVCGGALAVVGQIFKGDALFRAFVVYPLDCAFVRAFFCQNIDYVVRKIKIIRYVNSQSVDRPVRAESLIDKTFIHKLAHSRLSPYSLLLFPDHDCQELTVFPFDCRARNHNTRCRWHVISPYGSQAAPSGYL